MATVPDDTPLFFSSIGRWRQWLRRNQSRDRGAWILLAKKGTNPGISYPEALEEALCWGWIDGKLHRHDERYFAQWFSPRRSRSVWSLANRTTVVRLLAEGRMQPPGIARVEEAKASGRWDAAYASAAPPRMTAPVRQVIAGASLDSAWRKLAPSRRLMLLYWIREAKKPETKARRISQLAGLIRENRLPGFSTP